MVMEKVRLRLVFSGPRILRKSQKKQGLKKCWILIQPKLYKTISHLSDYLLRIFHLQHSSPHGLTLSVTSPHFPHFFFQFQFQFLLSYAFIFIFCCRWMTLFCHLLSLLLFWRIMISYGLFLSCIFF